MSLRDNASRRVRFDGLPGSRSVSRSNSGVAASETSEDSIDRRFHGKAVTTPILSEMREGKCMYCMVPLIKPRNWKEELSHETWCPTMKYRPLTSWVPAKAPSTIHLIQGASQTLLELDERRWRCRRECHEKLIRSSTLPLTPPASPPRTTNKGQDLAAAAKPASLAHQEYYEASLARARTPPPPLDLASPDCPVPLTNLNPAARQPAFFAPPPSDDGGDCFTPGALQPDGVGAPLSPVPKKASKEVLEMLQSGLLAPAAPRRASTSLGLTPLSPLHTASPRGKEGRLSQQSHQTDESNPLHVHEYLDEDAGEDEDENQEEKERGPQAGEEEEEEEEKVRWEREVAVASYLVPGEMSYAAQPLDGSTSPTRVQRVVPFVAAQEARSLITSLSRGQRGGVQWSARDAHHLAHQSLMWFSCLLEDQNPASKRAFKSGPRKPAAVMFNKPTKKHYLVGPDPVQPIFGKGYGYSSDRINKRYGHRHSEIYRPETTEGIYRRPSPPRSPTMNVGVLGIADNQQAQKRMYCEACGTADRPLRQEPGCSGMYRRHARRVCPKEHERPKSSPLCGEVVKPQRPDQRSPSMDVMDECDFGTLKERYRQLQAQLQHL